MNLTACSRAAQVDVNIRPFITVSDFAFKLVEIFNFRSFVLQDWSHRSYVTYAL
jgi:hypothetical protein